MPANITIVGNLGRDPETRYTPNGNMNVQFSVAVNSRGGRDASGQPQDRTTWYRVTAWERLAEQLDRMAQQGWLVKGRQVFVSGRFEAREYTGNDGQLRTSLDINASEVSFVGGNRQEGEGGGYQGGAGSGGSSGGGQQGGYSGESRGQQGGGASSDLGDLPGTGDIDDIPF
ncbi:MAG: single-stranded DNA-binding protein [Thermomicrobiales bacterium]|nr:single-stranded DNA-binding protein [Thermomicrobiales bacterium]